MASLHFDHYDGDGLLMVVGCAELIIGFSFFCLRLWSTRIAFRESKASAQKSLLVSVLLSIAVIFALASSGTLLYLARQHIGGNDPEKNLTTVRLQWTNFCLAVLCTAFIRVSNVASLLQMQRQRKAIAPWWLKGMGVAPGLIESAVIITIVVMLTHICDSADDFTPLSPYTRSSCRMAGVLLIALMVQGALSFIIDFLFGLYTWYLFRKMKLSRSRRIELLPFLLGGFVTFALAAVRFTTLVLLYRSTDQLRAAMATMMWFHTEQWGSIFIASWPRLQPLSKQVKAWKRANCPPDEQRSESPQDYDDGLSQTPMGFSPLRPSVRQEIERQRDQWLHPSAPPQHTATNMGVTVQTDYQVNYVSPNSEGNRSSDKIPTVVEGPGRTSRPSSSGF